jgi:hypothetical protein
MALPKIDVPVYELKLISTGKTVRFRPFTVKEEKLFLMANETNEIDFIIKTIKQVINNCVLDDVNVDDLPVFDIENIFLNLRAKSIGEDVSLKYRCNNDVKDGNGEEHKCGNLVQLDLNLLDIELPKLSKDVGKIMITDNLGLVMKYPTFDLVQKYQGKEDTETLLSMIVSCVDYIFDEEQIYYAKDTSQEEMVDFIENLQSKDLEKIKAFFDNMPKISKDIEFKCKKCGYSENINLQGVQSFFG